MGEDKILRIEREILRGQKLSYEFSVKFRILFFLWEIFQFLSFLIDKLVC